MIKIRNGLIGILLFICLLGGWYIYNYFFDISLPKVTLQGVVQNQYYNEDINCTINSDKKGLLNIYLDNQLIADNFMISANKPFPFCIPTHTITNGNHILSIEVYDSGYHKNKASHTVDFYVDNTPLQSAFVHTQPIKILQGRTAHIQFQTNKPVKHASIEFLSQTYTCFPEAKNSLVYETFIPIDCEELPQEYPFTAVITDNVNNQVTLHNKLQIVSFPFKKQSINLSAEQIEKEREIGNDAKLLEEQLSFIASNSANEKLWKGAFCTPIDIDRISCDFGTVRTTNYKGRYSHKALDVLNTPKTTVWASHSGIVALKDRYALTGNTVAIDHGMGVMSLYCHLEDFADIQVGDHIKQGNPLGRLGKTGHATGYHLHWEMRVHNVAIDPMQWTKQTF